MTRRPPRVAQTIDRQPPAQPAIAIVHVLYGIYHLSGTYRMRTPASAKSYHLFASVVDLAIITFYIFIAILAWRQHSAGIDNMDWRTVFNDNNTTEKLVLGVFLLAVSAGGLTLVTVLLNIYLIHAFRKLQSLPADGNPYFDDEDPLIEDNNEKRWSASTADSETPMLGGGRTVPFAATRIAPQKPVATGGKYTYQTLSLDNFDIGADSRRDSRREETLGAGYGQVESEFGKSQPADDDDEHFSAPSRTNTMSSLKRTRAVRPSSIGTLKGLKRDSFAPPPPDHSDSDAAAAPLSPLKIQKRKPRVDAPEAPAPALEKPALEKKHTGGIKGFSKAALLKDEKVAVEEPKPIVTKKSWGAAGGVQGFSKAAMLEADGGERTWRFSKVSGEAN